MTDQNEINKQFLAPPAVVALRKEDGDSRGRMERTISMDIREEREDLKEAAEQSLNVVLDLSLDGLVRWVSPSWKDVIGTSVESIRGKPITDILIDGTNRSAFSDAVESMKKDDSRSQIIRFAVQLGPFSVLKKGQIQAAIRAEDDGFRQDEMEEQEDEVLNLEGQGIMVYDRSSGGESHVGIPKIKRLRYVC